MGEVEQANETLRAVGEAARIEAVRSGKPASEWYDSVVVSPGSAAQPPQKSDSENISSRPETVFYGSSPEPVTSDVTGGCCGRQDCEKPALDQNCQGDYLPGTVAFLGVLDELKRLHLSKTQDYGDCEAGDALANIKNGSEMVGIAHWKGALVRAADKMQRLKTYCRNGRLVHEGVEDTLLDLAAYAVLALVLFRDDNP